MSKYTDYDSAKIATITVHSILAILNIAGNSLVCTLILKNRHMRTPVNYLLLNLAIADIMVAIFFAPGYILIHTFTHPGGMTGRLLCKLLTGGNVAWVASAASVVTLVAIAIERYYTVMYPHGNKRKLTNRKLKVIIPSSWIFGFIFLLQSFLIRTFDEERESCRPIWPKQWMGKVYSLTWLLVMALLPVSVMVALYSRVIYTLWFIDAESNQRRQGLLKVRKRVTLIAITVSVIFGVCWLTQSVSYVLSIFITTHKLGNVIYVPTQTTMIMVNSAINPFVYALLSQQFRNKLMTMICCSFRRPSDKLDPTMELQKMDPSSRTVNPIRETERGSTL